jgi:hypothetical protein
MRDVAVLFELVVNFDGNEQAAEAATLRSETNRPSRSGRDRARACRWARGCWSDLGAELASKSKADEAKKCIEAAGGFGCDLVCRSERAGGYPLSSSDPGRAHVIKFQSSGTGMLQIADATVITSGGNRNPPNADRSSDQLGWEVGFVGTTMAEFPAVAAEERRTSVRAAPRPSQPRRRRSG